jgi:hypothetical protein
MQNESENKILGLNISTAKKVIEADNKVIISGLSKGKKLPSKLRNELEEAIALETDETIFPTAKSWSDLAVLLGVTRRTLLRKRKNPDAPQTYSEVEAWVKFLDTDESDRGIRKLNDARLRILNIEAEDKKHKLDVRKGKYVLHAEVIEAWSYCVNLGISFLRSKFENELPPLFTYDPVANQKLARDAIDEYVTMMHNKGKHTP